MTDEKKAGKKDAEAETGNERRRDAESKGVAHRIWLASLGLVEVAGENGGRLFDYLVEKGESFEARHRDQFDSAGERARETARAARSGVENGWARVSEGVETKVSSALSRVGVTTRELERLRKRVEEISSRVDELKPDAVKS